GTTPPHPSLWSTLDRQDRGHAAQNEQDLFEALDRLMPVVELLTRITPMVLGLDHVVAEQTHLLTTPRHEPEALSRSSPMARPACLAVGHSAASCARLAADACSRLGGTFFMLGVAPQPIAHCPLPVARCPLPAWSVI